MKKQHVLIVQQGENPSTDFFIRSRFSDKNYTLAFYDLNQIASDEALEGSIVIFVRYVSPAWKALINKKQNVLAKLYYFMDDDLFDWRAARGLDWRYRWRLFWRAKRHANWLVNIGALLRVSNAFLANKYRHLDPEIWRPQSFYHQGTRGLVKAVECVADVQTPVVFYHGSSSHLDEVKWLRPVIEQVLAQHDTVTFELIGGAVVSKLFADLPRVRVVAQMRWTDYKVFVQQPGRTLGLAPLLPSAFNQARSETKFFDITAAGAVGIYADSAVYRSRVRPGENGCLVDMSHQSWVDAIMSLLEDGGLRNRLYLQAFGDCQPL